jgi:hypothetical protein
LGLGVGRGPVDVPKPLHRGSRELEAAVPGWHFWRSRYSDSAKVTSPTSDTVGGSPNTWRWRPFVARESARDRGRAPGRCPVGRAHRSCRRPPRRDRSPWGGASPRLRRARPPKAGAGRGRGRGDRSRVQAWGRERYPRGRDKRGSRSAHHRRGDDPSPHEARLIVSPSPSPRPRHAAA